MHGNITCLEIFEPECSVSIHVGILSVTESSVLVVADAVVAEALEDVAVEHYFVVGTWVCTCGCCWSIGGGGS